jgi:CRP-like cAMP-binding protein
MSTVESRDELYTLLGRAGKQVPAAAGEVIFEKGDRGDAMFIVVRGTVVLKDGDQTPWRRLGCSERWR